MQSKHRNLEESFYVVTNAGFSTDVLQVNSLQNGMGTELNLNYFGTNISERMGELAQIRTKAVRVLFHLQ